MKHVRDLSIKEIETLCRLYNECQLSVLEETELEYVLLCSAFSSDLIDETRKLMGVSRQMKFPKTLICPKRTVHRKIAGWTLGIAASVAMILIGSFFLLGKNKIKTSTDENYYVAYVEGKEVDEKAARKIAESEVVKVAAFMQLVESRKTIEQDKVRQFINHQKNKR